MAVLGGAAAGTVFWLGPVPASQAKIPLHFGDPHPHDWGGAKNAEFQGLEDVVISAIPVHNPSAKKVTDPPSWPENGALSCDSRHCPWYVTVATGDKLALFNSTNKSVSWDAVKNGKTYLRVSIDASQSGPAFLDISSLKPDVYEMVDPGSKERRGWLYRASAGETVVGPTTGNCRYSISLTPGKYRIRAWHPFLSAVEKPVDIRRRVTTRVNPVFSNKNLMDWKDAGHLPRP